ncbi:protein MpCPT5 [Marchantia polymorpha subsp. ruderalis]|uniref:Alkyl transferase n=2 Tax=Marchantia polymorpha TaxID=3197 RepID=A0A176WNL2_MARPO|nr:hypothetical protein AXG93_3205s1150 [Marchantia polymorpha subsp. ruderalis]PTQ29415.1 hypothetical protein MARPO_0142s0042 [Marchantia polymorpha]BBN06115.1 hypothetical protein Mp_3g18510 [Marchantia polymorpha subsp. ruderalis]|eukprot:PTQ29415.1 hypothetical protein MARPO_0142s0042 [Marchantia polymorpha]
MESVVARCVNLKSVQLSTIYKTHCEAAAPMELSMSRSTIPGASISSHRARELRVSLSRTLGRKPFPGAPVNGCVGMLHETAGTASADSCADLSQTKRRIELPPELNPEVMPKHVALILDGNNRYSKARGVRGSEGFEVGLKKSLKDAVRVSVDWGIEILTLFYFSYDNWNREKVEVETIFGLFEIYLIKYREAVMRYNIQFSVMGTPERFPETLQKLVAKVTEESRNNKGLKVVVAAGYGGRQDILQATQRISQLVANTELSIDEITLEVFESHLMTKNVNPSSVDLMIRTSGEQRISNFLLWQTAWTEFVFLKENWPEFRRDSMKNALISYQSRDRRLGLRQTKF